MLQEAKAQCDHLMVGLQDDPNIDRPDKNKPIQTYEERYLMLDAVKYVDLIIYYKTEQDLYDFLKRFEGQKNFVRILGIDHKGKKYTGNDLDIPIYFNSRDHNWSSTELRERIKKWKKKKV